MKPTIKFIAAAELPQSITETGVLQLANDTDPRGVELAGIRRIELNFPKFSDGRAYSQAFLLRRRLGFRGELRATGDVLVDQVMQMQRAGFDSAVLRVDQDLGVAQRQFAHFADFYQGDAQIPEPRFARTA